MLVGCIEIGIQQSQAVRKLLFKFGLPIVKINRIAGSEDRLQLVDLGLPGSAPDN